MDKVYKPVGYVNVGWNVEQIEILLQEFLGIQTIYYSTNTQFIFWEGLILWLAPCQLWPWIIWRWRLWFKEDENYL